MNNQPITTIVPDEIYTDRQEFIDSFYKLAINASGRRSMSSVFIGSATYGEN